MEAWYALYTKPNSEIRVYYALTARGFTVYLPLLPPHRDGRIRPLFSAYVFIHCDLESIGISSIKWIPGLRRILSFDGRPAVVPDEAIELIRAEMSQIEARGGLPKHHFKPGDQVVIDEGPLAGLRGIFQGPVGPAERVHILIDFLGHANRAEVPVEVLRSAPDVASRRRRGTRGRGRRIHSRTTSPGQNRGKR